MKKETNKEYRLNQFMKWDSWEKIYYSLTIQQREKLFDWVEKKIIEFEKEDL